MGNRLVRLAPILVGLLGTGCAYEFSEKYFLEGAKFRRDPSHLIHDLHDLEPGTATMVILRDSQAGMNIGTGNTLKLGFEIHKFEVGVPIDLPSKFVAVRFSDLDGDPPKKGRVSGTTLPGSTITVLEKTEHLLLLECHLIMKMTEVSGRGTYDADEEEIEGIFECSWIEGNLKRLDPYYGGMRDTYIDDDSRDK